MNTLEVELTQLKWQFVRSMEALQYLERENVHLKQMLSESRTISEEGSKKEEEHLQSVNTLRRIIKDHSSKQKDDFKRLQLSFKQEMKILVHQHELLKLCFQKSLTLLERSEVSLKTSKEAHSLAEKQLADQAKVQNSQKITQSQDLTDAKSQIKELQSQLNAANCEKEKLKSESLFLKGKADEVNIQLEKMGLKYQNLEMDFNKFKRAAAEKDTNRVSQIAALKETQQQTQSNYEKILEQLNFENQFLRDTVVDLEEQVRKLSMSLVGNKSHFAKYIEVKTENVNLQTKLDSLLTGKSSVANRHKPPSLSLQPPPVQRLPSQRDVPLDDSLRKTDSLHVAMTADPSKPPSVPIQSPRLSGRFSFEPTSGSSSGATNHRLSNSSFTNHMSIFNSGLSVVMPDPSRPRQPALAADSGPVDSALRLDSYREVDSSSLPPNNNLPQSGNSAAAVGVKKSLRIARSSSSNSNFEADSGGIAVRSTRRSGDQVVNSTGRDQGPLPDRVLI